MNEIYSFSSDGCVVDSEMIETMGIRGKRVVELVNLGVPTLPGFVLNNDFLGTTEGTMSKGYLGSFKKAINQVGKIRSKKYADPQNPLLLKMVVSPMLNVVDTVFSIHIIGL